MSSSDGVVPRKKGQKEDCVPKDCISGLPEDVISLILSKISTSEAVATSALSKHWRYKWASLHHIDCNDRKIPFIRRRFLESVILHMEDVRSVRLQLYDEYCSGQLEKSLSDLLKRKNVEKLHITICQRLILPESLFNSTSLKDLVLKRGFPYIIDTYSSVWNAGPLFIVPSKHCLLNLKSLYLSDLRISNKYIVDDEGNSVYNFPVLENLEVYRCMWSYGAEFCKKSSSIATVSNINNGNVQIICRKSCLFAINIYAPALTTLKYETEKYNLGFYSTVNIHAPRLAHFSMEGEHPETFSLTRSQVVCAKFQCAIDDEDLALGGWTIQNILQDMVPTLETLYVSTCVAQAILERKKETDRPLPRFDKLRTVTVNDDPNCDIIINAEAVLDILNATPFLQCLKIDTMFYGEYDYDAAESVPWCIANSLEELHICDILGRNGMSELAAFCLKTATKLKEFHADLSFGDGIPVEEAKDIISRYHTASADIAFKWTCSRYVRSRHTADSSRVGNVAFISPEQVKVMLPVANAKGCLAVAP